MREINKISEALFEKIRDRFEDVSLGDENAKATQDPEQARFFNFDYTVDGHNFGNITLSVIDETSLKVYFSKNISDNLDDEQKKQWYSFLRELREFARRNLLSFEPRDITRSTLKHRDIEQQSKADSTYSQDELNESRLHGTSRSSYENDGNVRIIVRHSQPVVDEIKGARARHIRAIYLENAEGERLKLPHNSLRYARAMARHVAEGGSISDEFGQHITNIAEECSKLKPFKHAVLRRTFEDAETQSMVEAAFEYHSLLSNTLKKMGGRKGYNAYKENYQADNDVLLDDFDAESMRERFVKRSYNDALDTALPVVQKAYKMKKENKFAEQFEAWADKVSEGTWAVPSDDQDYNKLSELLQDELPVGVDAENATAALYDLIGDDVLFDRLLDLAKQNPKADARPIITTWLENNKPDVYQKLLQDIGDDSNYPPEQTEGAYADPMGSMDGVVYEDDYDEDQVESITTAIVRRILNNIGQHKELLMKAGPDGVLNAAKDVASFHVPVEELGSSDISNMVREVYREVGVDYPEMNESLQRGDYHVWTVHFEDGTSKKIKVHSDETSDSDLQNHFKGQKIVKVDRDYSVHSPHDTTPTRHYWTGELIPEGRVKEVAMDLDDLTDEEFKAKYGKTKEEMKAALSETQGADYVNKDEKLKRMGAKELGVMDKLKNIPQGLKAAIKGDSEDELALYNKSKESLEEMRRLAGL